MEKIELIIDEFGLDTFVQAASDLGIQEFEVTSVRRSSPQYVHRQRLYRGLEYSINLPPKAKIEFTVFDEDSERILNELITVLDPDKISILQMSHVVVLGGSTAPIQNYGLGEAKTVQLG